MQDDWRLNPKLVLNLGVRYDYFGRFQSRRRPTPPTRPASSTWMVRLTPNFTFGPPRSPDEIVEDDKGINVGPRIGFAYNPDGNGNTVVSGGWGLMFQSIDPQVFEALQIGMRSGLPVNLDLQRCGSGCLRAEIPHLQRGHRISMLEATPPPGRLYDSVGPIIDPHIQAPYAHVFTVGMQRALGSATVVNAAYVGTRGNNFRLYRTYNLPDRVTGIRPNPDLNQNQLPGRLAGGRSTTPCRPRSSRGCRGSCSSISTTPCRRRAPITMATMRGAASTMRSTIVQDFFDLDANWGPAIGDVRHNFMGDVIYQTPGAELVVTAREASARRLADRRRSSGCGPASRFTITQTGRQVARPGCPRRRECDQRGLLRYLQPATCST